MHTHTQTEDLTTQDTPHTQTHTHTETPTNTHTHTFTYTCACVRQFQSELSQVGEGCAHLAWQGKGGSWVEDLGKLFKFKA